MTDEVSNGNAKTSNNAPITATQISANLISHAEYNSRENIAIIDTSVGGSGRNSRPRITPVQNQPQVIVGWLPFGLPSGYTPPMGSYTFPIRFGNVPGTVSNQLSFSYPNVYRDYQVSSSSNNSRSMAAFRQYIDKSHHDLVNLLTHQMITILNPILVDNESKYDRLVKQVERIARIENVGYNVENVFINPEREENVPYLIRQDQNTDEVLNRLHTQRGYHYQRVRQVEKIKEEKKKEREMVEYKFVKNNIQ
ncbi:hypothetical protein Ahy_B08g092540 [Arachis hypogaea]|uniref:Uncharacterized protein n=1 Tax=Arachis hypogaea TaxID=3818 RepID=A0A444Y477_ARAHY|nr:hypothetical protein Ahy_B08g092540 [Arachis hypogaea]